MLLSKSQAATTHPYARRACLWLTIFLCLSPAVQAAPANPPVKPQAEAPKFHAQVMTVLTSDDRGDPLKMPSALFFDPTSDELYLLDNNGPSRFINYGSDYFPQDSLGAGRGIETPTGGCVDAEGNLYLLQSATSSKPARVTVLNQAFLPVREIILASVAPDLKDFSPQRVAATPDGKLYIAGLETSRVLVLGRDGHFIEWFEVGIDKHWEYHPGQPTPAPDQADARTQPCALTSEKFTGAIIRNLAVDARGDLFFLSEDTSKVYVFDDHEHFLFSFGTKGGSDGKLSRPRALAIDEKKKCIYVVDYMRHTVLMFNLSGEFLFEFGGRGWGPGWFNYPVDVVVGHQGQVIVADLFNQRAQVFEVKAPPLPDRDPKLWQAKSGGGE